MKILLLLSFILNCAGGMNVKSGNSDNSFVFKKKEGFNSNTKRVSTLSIYNRDTKKIGDVTDLITNIVGITIDTKIGELYGDAIVGGAAIKEIATKLKLKDFDKSIQNLIESQLDGVALNPETKKTFLTITDKGKVDSLAFPVISAGTDKIMKGDTIEISLIVFDGKSANIQYIASKAKITAKPEDLQLLASKPDQARANTTSVLIESVNKFMSEVQKEVKPQSIVASNEPTKGVSPQEDSKEPAKSSEVVESEVKEKEVLQPLNDWLVKKVRIGLGPIVLIFNGLLFILL